MKRGRPVEGVGDLPDADRLVAVLKEQGQGRVADGGPGGGLLPGPPALGAGPGGVHSQMITGLF